MYTLEHRPFSFDEMIGNKGTLSEMKKRSETMDFPEVMIFEGASGTGKTTLAFIISALINDTNPLKIRGQKYLNPNPNSPSSKNVLEEKFSRDIHFYDASTMGKDDVSKLESVVSTAPMFDKKKVIIIDEAQELTKSGKGVTLKLLEKKRKNAHIILCTMNINAFDKAVKTRGQLYTFRSPSSTDIAEYLYNISEKVGATPPDEFYESGIFVIAENCEGSIRSAVQNLERCLVGEFYSEEQIQNELGFLSTNALAKIISKIFENDMSVMKDIIDFSVKEFFYKTKKTITEAAIYKNIGFIKADWKKGFAKKISKYDLDGFVDMLMRVDSETYFKEDFFLYELSKFMKNSQKITKKREPVS